MRGGADVVDTGEEEKGLWGSVVGDAKEEKRVEKADVEGVDSTDIMDESVGTATAPLVVALGNVSSKLTTISSEFPGGMPRQSAWSDLVNTRRRDIIQPKCNNSKHNLIDPREDFDHHLQR